tara:strand:- start:6614 stop:7009 length:396 start_codon:yes stop_codon:yes gene_type:complete
LSNQSCTCSDWKDFRQGQNLGDPGRLCSHLARAFRDTLSGQDSVPTHTRVLLEDLDQRGCGGQLDFTWQLLEFQDDKILAGHVGPIWCHVYGPSKSGDCERFSYHRVERRWFFGAKPKHVHQLKKFLDTLK